MEPVLYCVQYNTRGLVFVFVVAGTQDGGRFSVPVVTGLLAQAAGSRLLFPALSLPPLRRRPKYAQIHPIRATAATTSATAPAATKTASCTATAAETAAAKTSAVSSTTVVCGS